MDGRPNILDVDNAYSLEVSVYTPLSHRKMTNDESSCTSAMAVFFVQKKVMVLIIIIRWSIRVTWWWWWNMPTRLCFWWKEKYSTGWSLTMIYLFDLSLGIHWEVPLSPINWRRQKHIFLHCVMVCVVFSFPMTFGCPRQHCYYI